jgi:hypothetical protein
MTTFLSSTSFPFSKLDTGAMRVTSPSGSLQVDPVENSTSFPFFNGPFSSPRISCPVATVLQLPFFANFT